MKLTQRSIVALAAFALWLPAALPAALGMAGLASVIAPAPAMAAEARPSLPKARPAGDGKADELPRPRPAGDGAENAEATPPTDAALAEEPVAAETGASDAEAEAPDLASDTASAADDKAQETATAPDEPAATAAEGETAIASAEPAPAPEPEKAEAATQAGEQLAFFGPRPRPQPEGAAAARLARIKNDRPPFGFADANLLKRGLDLVTGDAYTSALAFSRELPSTFDRKLVAWFVARAPISGLSAAEIGAVLERHPDWPEPELLELRAEQAFLRSGPGDGAVRDYYASHQPLTDDGWLKLADAYADAGETGRSRPIVRRLWREKNLRESLSAHILAEHAAALSKQDHLFRFRRLLLQRRSGDAIKVGQAIGPGYDQLARAVAGVIARKKGAEASLMALKDRFRDEPAFEYARVLLLHRDGRNLDAGLRLGLVTRDAAGLGDGDRWWELRKDIARALLDAGYPALAYSVAATHAAVSPEDLVEAEFHAGWLALRYLDSPRAARGHFARIAAVATQPRSIARAYYWLGRAHAAAGAETMARLAYGRAAEHGATYYGQLARDALGIAHTGLEMRPRPSALDRLRFAARDEVHAIKRLAAAGHSFRTRPFFLALGDKLKSPGELALLDTLARRIEEPHLGMLAAARADAEGVDVGALRAPLIVVPTDIPQPDIVDRALLYAVSKQESAFNASATSHVGARGLMQFMPATARSTARQIGLPFSLVRLSSDPAYNATLGAAHLGELLTNLRGSYIMTFAGYNAGPGRAIDWVRRYGDPRGGVTDPVDWVERIPFDETRNYVQKVMENLQSYRSRLGHALSITSDLKHGEPIR
ncbi:lytic transglycosylase domain-containing protein [Afifella sp. IM 167]|uniref:lytic transglycosylase domain-containing protein n=1 Tax=Afifella sp. IM 167 TaxID=2033586 RepID=UPI002714539B|nr:transglycosylase SLT domain-containing protein [Afifella sp. IM 167]MBZ8131899.1 lytic transglycosylase [Afifella sp. IM 167]